MKRLVVLCLTFLSLAVGGCVGDGSPRTSASSPDELHPKQMCEATSIGGQPKTVCY